MFVYTCKIIFKCDFIIIFTLAIIYQKKFNNLFQITAKSRANEKLFEAIGEFTYHQTGEGCVTENINNSILISNNSIKGRTHAYFYKQTAGYTKTT